MAILFNSILKKKFLYDLLHLLITCIFLGSLTACGKPDDATQPAAFLLPTVATETRAEIIPTLPSSPVIETPMIFPDAPSFLNSTMISEIDGMEMVFIPAGSFEMGCNDGDPDEKPVHEVYLDAYWIDKYEVTHSQYNQCIQSGVCTSPSNDYFLNHIKFQDHPVTYVNWDQASAYCQWTGRRLPTEAEWEKAARGTDGNMYPWGNVNPNCDLSNFKGCIDQTMTVGSYIAGQSPYGVMDISGNVGEWTSDWYDKDYYQYS